MDWFLAARDAKGARELRRQIGGFLRRHAADPREADDAELVVEELIGNALRHSNAPVWVTLDWTGPMPELTVNDLGEAFDVHQDLPEDELSERGRGLFLAAHLTKELSRAARSSGGNRVTATLLVERAKDLSMAPPHTASQSLPMLDEADVDGGFGKESFLRALAVQLADSVEQTHGAVAAQRAVAQVGTDVGGQMEAAYRAAERISGKLTPEQIADCYMRLNAAIGGEFYVIEIDEDHVVLGNRACPFGEVVRRSPSLCRMTSSVFGGIAARNADGATVLLEERIALGDPECRVVVKFGATQSDGALGHVYPAPEKSGPAADPHEPPDS